MLVTCNARLGVPDMSRSTCSSNAEMSWHLVMHAGSSEDKLPAVYTPVLHMHLDGVQVMNLGCKTMQDAAPANGYCEPPFAAWIMQHVSCSRDWPHEDSREWTA